MKKSYCLLLLIYIAVSLLAGEFHPFSRYEMYSSFPETALTFSLTNTQGVVVPLQKYYKYKTADLSHNYAAAEQAARAEKNRAEKDETGRAMFNQLSDYRYRTLNTDAVILTKTELYFDEKKLKVLHTPIYEYHQ